MCAGRILEDEDAHPEPGPRTTRIGFLCTPHVAIHSPEEISSSPLNVRMELGQSAHRKARIKRTALQNGISSGT
jgi:hypothetical protein